MPGLTVSVPIGSISSRKRTLKAVFRFHYPCCLCGKPDHEMAYTYDVIIDYSRKELYLIAREKQEKFYVLCGTCFDLMRLKEVPEIFSKPFRDLPLLIHDKNLIIRDIARHRLNMPE